MTQEEKELLLKDLCSRSPYGVKVHINSPIEEQNSMELFDINLDGEHIGVGNEKWAFRAIPIIDDEDETKVIKPYLRPMSTMTEEEGKELEHILCEIDAPCWVDTEYGCVNFAGGNDFIDTEIAEVYTDWLNKKMFDYRGLIEKGLAIKAPEGMYKNE